MIYVSIENKGTICTASPFTKSEKSKNTVGWACCVTEVGNATKLSRDCIVKEPCLKVKERSNKNRSYDYIIKDPENNVYYIGEGGLESFCKKEGLSFGMMWNSFKSEGERCAQRRNKTKKTIKTVGWSCSLAGFENIWGK